MELTNRLDEITIKLDSHDTPAHQFATKLKELIFKDDSGQMSRKNQELVQILWGTDRTSWGISQRSQPVHASQSVDGFFNDNITVAETVLSNLAFSDMHSREGGIPKTCADTFEWAFQDQQTDEHGEEVQWSSFPAWLREALRSVYWITGKPGSGKSTLMKFIFEHPQLRDHLSDYAKDLPLMLAAFFFWNPGSKMQKSQEGLVRTLLHQCLDVRQDLIPAVLPRRWALYNLLGRHAIAPEWTWKELEESFAVLCSYHGKEFRLAVFVDGLDEFDGDPKVLINWVKENIVRCDIKLCVSSRPWSMFSDAFSQGHSLTMQNLTRRDIERFVKTEFDNSPAFQDLKEVFHDQSHQLLNDIASKAEGVFLWVTLVVRSLLETLTDNPSLQHIEAKLAETPTRIMDLYRSIWNSIPSERVPTSSSLFQLCVTQNLDLEYKITVEHFWLAAERDLTKPRAIFTDENARQGIPKVLKRLFDGHTRGILEISGDQVRFLHRSARDWITNDDIWREICTKAPAEFEAHLALLEAVLAQPPAHVEIEDDLYSFVQACLFYARGATNSAKVEENRLLQAINCINGVACDLSVAATDISRRPFVDSKHPERDEYSLGHWSTVQYHNEEKENCFTGIAAQAGLFEYVQEKVLANKKLLDLKDDRISILENAIFPGLLSVQLCTNYQLYPFIPPKPVGKKQLRIVQFLLNECNARYETAFGDSLYDIVIEAQQSDRENPDPLPPSWYAEVLQLLKDHGYGPRDSGNCAKSDQNQAEPHRGGHEVNKTTSKPRQEATRAKRLRLRLRTMLTRFCF